MGEGGLYVLMLLVVGYREPALAAPVFDDHPACVAAGKELERRAKQLKGYQAPTTVIWFCTPQSSDPRRE